MSWGFFCCFFIIVWNLQPYGINENKIQVALFMIFKYIIVNHSNLSTAIHKHWLLILFPAKNSIMSIYSNYITTTPTVVLSCAMSSIQLSAVITWSSTVRYCINHWLGLGCAMRHRRIKWSWSALVCHFAPFIGKPGYHNGAFTKWGAF